MPLTAWNYTSGAQATTNTTTEHSKFLQGLIKNVKTANRFRTQATNSQMEYQKPQSNGISKATNSQMEYQKPQTVKWNIKSHKQSNGIPKTRHVILKYFLSESYLRKSLQYGPSSILKATQLNT